MYLLAYLTIKFLRKSKEIDEYALDHEDAIADRVSIWLCTFTLATCFGAVLLLPMSIIANEIIRLTPQSFYWKWLNSSLLYGKFLHKPGSLRENLIIWMLEKACGIQYFCFRTCRCSCSCRLLIYSSSRSVCRATRRASSRASSRPVCSSSSSRSAWLACRLLPRPFSIPTMPSRSLFWVSFSQIFFLKFKKLYNIFFWQLDISDYHLPFLYSCISFIGVLFLLICTPLGFARLFTIVSNLIMKSTVSEIMNLKFFLIGILLQLFI